MSEQNKTVVRRIIEEHWNNKNAAIVSELFASNVSLDTPDGVLTGLEGAGSLLQAYETAFPDFHNTTDDLFADVRNLISELPSLNDIANLSIDQILNGIKSALRHIIWLKQTCDKSCAHATGIKKFDKVFYINTSCRFIKD